MNKLIVVCGLGGSGKTTLANALAKRTGIDRRKSLLHPLCLIQ